MPLPVKKKILDSWRKADENDFERPKTPTTTPQTTPTAHVVYLPPTQGHHLPAHLPPPVMTATGRIRRPTATVRPGPYNVTRFDASTTHHNSYNNLPILKNASQTPYNGHQVAANGYNGHHRHHHTLAPSPSSSASGPRSKISSDFHLSYDEAVISSKNDFRAILEQCQLTEDQRNEIRNVRRMEKNKVSPAPAPSSSSSLSPPNSRQSSDLLPPDCPFTFDEVVNSEIDNFNDLMGQHGVSESDIAKYRDIRRKGKNRISARGCRNRVSEGRAVNQALLETRQREKSQLEMQKLRLKKLANSADIAAKKSRKNKMDSLKDKEAQVEHLESERAKIREEINCLNYLLVNSRGAADQEIRRLTQIIERASDF